MIGLAGLLSNSCLSLNEQFAQPHLEATGPADSDSATTPDDSAKTSNDASGATDEHTIDPVQTSSEVATTQDPTPSETSGDANSSTSTATLTETTSSSTSSSSTQSTSGSDTTPQSCQNPTLCFDANPGRSINRIIMAPFAHFALRFPREEESLYVARVDVYTGSLTGTHSISIRPDTQNKPDNPVRTEFFSATVIQRWYATTFDPPVEVSPRAPHWISWHPPGGSLGSSALFGQHLSGKQKLFSNSPWRDQDYPIMMRLYCCP